MVELKAAAISTSAVLGIVSPHAGAIKPILFTRVNLRTSLLQPFRVFSIDQGFDISLLCSFRINGDGVDENMLGSLEFNRAATGVSPIRGNGKITVVCPIQKLCALVVVEHAEGHVFVGVYLAHIKGKPLPEEILPPIEDVQR